MEFAGISCRCISFFCYCLQMLEQILKILLRLVSFIISTEDFRLYMKYTAVMFLSNTHDSAVHPSHTSLKSIWSRSSLYRVGSYQLPLYTLFSSPMCTLKSHFYTSEKSYEGFSLSESQRYEGLMIINPSFQSQVSLFSMSGSLPLPNYDVSSLI